MTMNPNILTLDRSSLRRTKNTARRLSNAEFSLRNSSSEISLDPILRPAQNLVSTLLY